MREGFDCGADVKENSFCAAEIKVYPTEGEMTILGDADAIPYIVGFNTTEQEIIDYNRGDKTVLERKYQHAQFVLNQWMKKAKADSALLYVTKSANNFRLKIGRLRLYKGQREVNEKPPFFEEIKQWLIDTQGAIVADGCEADDLISIEAWRRIKMLEEEGAPVGSSAARQFSDWCIVSQDKDLMIIPHLHCNPDTGEFMWVTEFGHLTPVYKQKEVNDYQQQPLFDDEPVDPAECQTVNLFGQTLYGKDNKLQDVVTRGDNKNTGKFRRVCVGTTQRAYIDKLRGCGMKFFYAQLLTGDTVDNYGGLEGCGKTTAFELLESCKTEEELHEAVYGAYLDSFGDGEVTLMDYKDEPFTATALDLLREQGQLAHMQQKENELWQPLPLRE